VCVLCRILLVQIAKVFWGPVWWAFQWVLGLRGLTISSITGASVGVGQATMATRGGTHAKFQAGAASFSGCNVQRAIGGGVRALYLQGAQVLWGTSLILISHLWHHQWCTVHWGWKYEKRFHWHNYRRRRSFNSPMQCSQHLFHLFSPCVLSPAVVFLSHRLDSVACCSILVVTCTRKLLLKVEKQTCCMSFLTFFDMLCYLYLL